jgi:hypothetical protein
LQSNGQLTLLAAHVMSAVQNERARTTEEYVCMTKLHPRARGSIGPIAILGTLLSLLPACTSEDVAHGRAVSIDRTTAALLVADLESVDGTYTNCARRMGSWSLEIEPGATLTNLDPLSVVLNDTDCELSLTALRTTADTLLADPAIALDTTYEAVASSFDVPVAFYANARLSAGTFAADFVLTILYSDDSSFALASNTATVAVSEATAIGTPVDAPDYTLDMTTLIVAADIDDVVASVTGSAGLTDGDVTGQRYVVLDVADLDNASYDLVDAAFIAGTDAAIAATIPASDFMSLVGADLGTAPEVRTLILANTVSGVAAYQVFTITFNPTPP